MWSYQIYDLVRNRFQRKKSVRSKFNFKFSNLLHMSKGHIFIENYMNMVFMVLGYDHVNFYFFPVLIIAHVSPESSTTRGPFSEALSLGNLSENGNHS